MSDDPKPPRAHPFPDHDSIEFLIAHLRRLEETSAPPSAADFPPEWEGPYFKDGNATQALEGGAHLLGRMIRWAIRHKTGLAANGLLPGAPRYIGQFDPQTTKFELKKQIKKANEASDDRHEADGEAYEPGGDDPTVDRQVMATLLKFYEPLFPPKLARYLANSLLALNRGQTLPLLERRKKRAKDASFDRWFDQWTAVLHVEYLRGSGLSRGDTKEHVAKAYGVEFDTVDKWAGRVPKEVPGFDDFDSTKADVRRMGQRAKALFAKKKLAEDEQRELQRLEDDWGLGVKRDGKKDLSPE